MCAASWEKREHWQTFIIFCCRSIYHLKRILRGFDSNYYVYGYKEWPKSLWIRKTWIQINNVKYIYHKLLRSAD